MKQQFCKFTLEDGSKCGSVFHTAMYHKPKTPIRRALRITKEEFSKEDKKVFNKKKTKKETRSGITKRLDNIFSWYIRLRYAVDYNDEKMAICVTCKSMKRWQEQQNGHFYTRGRLPTRWDETNCQVQCMRCNVFLKGNYIKYTVYMLDTFGRDALDELEQKSLSIMKIPTSQLKEMIVYYSGQVDNLLK